MADYDLGTARGKIEIDASGVDAGINKAIDGQSKFQQSQAKSSDTMLKAGVGMLAGAAAIGAGFAVAINASADFEKQISGIAAVSGATGDQLDQIRDKALQLGKDTVFSAAESAQAMEELVKAGLTVPDVLNGAADAAVNLAAAGGIDIPQAATIAANAMNIFKLSAEQMPHVADLIAGAANASAIDVSDFGLALSQVGTVADLSGLSLDDLSVAIAAMGNAGIKGSDAGTSLKTFLSNLIPTTKQQTTLMKELGLVTADGANQFFDASGKIKGMADISETLKNSLAGMTEEQKIATLQTLFGSDAIRAASVIADGGADSFNALAQQMGNVTAQDVAAKRMDNLNGSIEQLKGSLETLLIIVGKPLADALRVWVDRGTEVLNFFIGLDPHIWTVVASVGKFIGTLLGIVGAVLVAAGAIGKIKTAWAAFNVVLEANPLVLIAVLLAALGVAFYTAYQNIKPFHEWVDKTVHLIADFLAPTIDAIKGAFGEFWTVLSTGMTENEGGSWWENFAFLIRDVAHWITDELIPAFNDFWTVLTTGMTNDEGGTWFENLAFTIRDVAHWITDVAWPAVDGFVNAIGGWKTVLEGVGIALATIVAPWAVLAAAVIYAYNNFDVFRNIVNTTIKVLVAIGKGIAIAAQTIIKTTGQIASWLNDNVFPTFEALGELVQAFVDRAIDVWVLLWPVIKAVLDNIIEGIKFFIRTAQTIWDAFGDHIWTYIKTVFGIIQTVVESALQVVRGIIEVVTGLIHGDWSKVWQGISDIFSGIWHYMSEIPGEILDLILNAIGTGLNAIGALWTIAWDLVQTVLSNAWHLISTIVTTGIDDIVGFIRDIPSNLASFIGTVFDGLVNAASGAVDAVINFFRDLPGRIGGFISDVGGKMLEMGGTIVDKLSEGLSGIGSFIGDIAGAIGDAVKGAINALIDILNDGIPNSLGWGFASIDLPDNPIPRLHSGGIVPGSGEVPAVLLSGEGVLSRSQMSWFANLLSSLGGSLSGFFGGSMPTYSGTTPTQVTSGGGASAVVLHLNFPNVGSGEDASDIKSALSSPGVLSELTRSIRAGVGAA